MTWQILLVSHIVLSVAAELLRRRLGKSIPQYNKLVNGVSFLVTHLPSGIIAAHLIGYDLNIDALSIFALVIGTVIWPLTSMIGFRASKDVDAGLFSILSTIGPVITIVLAMILLDESLSNQQAIGAIIIIGSAVLVTAPSYNRSTANTKKGIILALISISVVAAGTVYETWMLNRIGLGTYLLLGWSMQAVWMTVFAWPERHRLKQICNRRHGLPILLLAVIRTAKGMTFLGALSLLNSASVFSSYKSIMPVLVVGASYIILKEKQMIVLRIIAGIICSAGLLVLSLS